MKKTTITSSKGGQPTNIKLLPVSPVVASSWKLAKVPLCLLIGCSTVFGALLSGHPAISSTLKAGGGVFLLALGAATLNSLQEVETDGRMKRTADRPLVVKSLSLTFASIQSGILIALGLFFLSRVPNPVLPVTLGSVSILLYNGIYTRLKQKTTLAIFPGAVCGSAPPLIGWVSAGGDVYSFKALLLFTVLFLWQVPHFFLILLRYKEDYLTAQQPSFLQLFSERGVRWLSCAWIFSLSLVMMLFAITGKESEAIYRYLIIGNAAVFSLLANYDLMVKATPAYNRVFLYLNSMLFLHMMFVSLPVLFSPYL